eukprot:gene25492-biopygen13523
MNHSRTASEPQNKPHVNRKCTACEQQGTRRATRRHAKLYGNTRQGAAVRKLSKEHTDVALRTCVYLASFAAGCFSSGFVPSVAGGRSNALRLSPKKRQQPVLARSKAADRGSTNKGTRVWLRELGQAPDQRHSLISTANKLCSVLESIWVAWYFGSLAVYLRSNSGAVCTQRNAAHAARRKQESCTRHPNNAPLPLEIWVMDRKGCKGANDTHLRMRPANDTHLWFINATHCGQQLELQSANGAQLRPAIAMHLRLANHSHLRSANGVQFRPANS